MQISISEMGQMTPAELETLAVTIQNGWPRILNYSRDQFNQAAFCLAHLPRTSDNERVVMAREQMQRQRDTAERIMHFVPEQYRENINRPINKVEILRMVRSAILRNE
jgi:hypothetical protein